MKKKVLIIRSVSFQQLDKNLNGILKKFPPEEYELYLLTHSHGLERAGTYHALSGIVDYESRKNFTFFHVPAALRHRQGKSGDGAEPFETVIMPVTNTTGTGFLNVLAMTLRIPCQTIYVCNLVSEFREVSKAGIVGGLVKSFLFSILSAIVAIPMALVMIPPTLIGLIRKKR